MSVPRSAFDVQSSAPAVRAPDSPWLGLASFTEETRALFHGRLDEVEELARMVQRRLLTVLFGQSGLGKTSMLRAGLVPRLRPEGYCPIYVRLDYTKEARPPAEQIKEAVARATQAAGSWSQPGAAREGESLWEFFHHRGDVLADSSGRVLTPLLIFDQFEEVFTLAQTDDAGRARANAFLVDLADLVENRAPRALEEDETAADRFDFARTDYRVLIALREDYLAHLESLRRAMPSITQNRLRLTRMAGGPALEAVLRPGAGLVSDEVARQIVRFVSGARDLATAEVEPSLLSLVCRELNEMRLAQGRPEISADLLEGSREMILNEFYDRSLADQPEGVRRFIEDELLTDSGFRESLAEERAQKVCTEAGAPDALRALVDRRLLRIEERLDVRRVELTHDVLCGVVKSRRDTRRDREAREAAERRAIETEAREAQTKRALWRARMVAVSCAVLAVLAIGSAIFGYISLRDAREANARADTARAQAESLVGYMINDLQPALEQYGRLPLLRGLTEQSLRYFDSLPAELRDIDTDRQHAAVLVTYATILDDVGDKPGAAVVFGRSLPLMERVVAANPESVDDRARLIARRNMMIVYFGRERSTPDEVLATFQTNIAALAELHQRHPDNQEVLRWLGELRMRHGWFVVNDLNQPGRALPIMLAAQKNFQELLAVKPDDRRYRSWNSRILGTLSGAYSQLLDFSKALQLARESVDYTENALKQDPGNKVLLMQAADAAQNLSYRASESNRQLSIQAELIARDRFRTLSELDPENHYLRRDYIWSHIMEPYGLEAQGHYAAARKAFEVASNLFDEDPEAARARGAKERPAELALDQARMAAHAEDSESAMRLLAKAHRAFASLYPDANPRDPSYRKESVRWQLREMEMVTFLADWPALIERSQAVLAEVDAGLLQSSDDPELLLRRAEARRHLGNAWLKQGKISAAVEALAAAVQDYRDTPPVPQSRLWDRASLASIASIVWADALIAAGERSRARVVLEQELPYWEKMCGAQPDLAFGRGWLARTRALLAATFERTSSADRARRAELLEQASELVRKLESTGSLTAEVRETKARIESLKAEA